MQLYQAAASSRIAQVERIQLAFLIAGALAVTFSVGLINWQIIRPLDVLEARVRQVIDGDLVSPVPIVAQNEIGRVARSFDKMRRHLSEQLERIAALHDDAVAELKRNAGTQFDPKIVEIFLRLLEHGLDVTEETKPFLLSERWDS